MKQEFGGFDFTNFRDDNYYARKEYIGDAPTDELVADVERELGYKLPASYIWLMKQYNGGIPLNTCLPTDSPTSWVESHTTITGTYGMGREKDYPLYGEIGNQLVINEWGYPEIGVATCDCPSAGHDMIFLDYQECGPFGGPKVMRIDQELDFKVTTLAEGFEDFIRELENAERYEGQ